MIQGGITDIDITKNIHDYAKDFTFHVDFRHPRPHGRGEGD